MSDSIALKYLILCLVIGSSLAAPEWFSIVQQNSEWNVVPARRPDFFAEAVFDKKSINSTGWMTLGVYTPRGNLTIDAATKSFAAGYLEGYITAEEIWHFRNSIYSSSGLTEPLPQSFVSWITSNIQFARSQSSLKSNLDDHIWKRVALIMKYFDGMIAGFSEAIARSSNPNRNLTIVDLWILNGNGDLLEIQVATGMMSKQIFEAAFHSQNHRYGIPVFPAPPSTRCSALIKVTNDFSNLIVGHTTWENYVQMLRIWKTYDLDIFGARLTVSGYPGMLASVDDFYYNDKQLIIMETTNGFYNLSLLESVKPNSLLTFMRSVVSSLASTNCIEWMSMFGKYNSGTYNNQWMCLDYKLFTKHKPLKPNTLWIGEQLPGIWVTHDVTTYLARGYWASYNVPFDEYIYNISGFSLIDTYELAARAKIFRRDHSKVIDIPSMQHMIRYNDYKNDPFSNGDPTKAVAARFDLITWFPTALGSVDGKVMDADSMKAGTTWIQSGPSYDQLPVFSWDDPKWKDQPHGGQPTSFKFGWVPVQLP